MTKGLINCNKIEQASSPTEALSMISRLTEMITEEEGSEFGLGLWSVEGQNETSSKVTEKGQIAVFGKENGLIAPCGEFHNSSSEAVASLLVTVLANADQIKAAVKKLSN